MTSCRRRLRATRTNDAPRPEPPTLATDNGIGGFSDGGREYVMRVREHELPPMPWCNVMANAHFGTLVPRERLSSFTWYGNSQRHRLTPWSNDVVCDPSGELFYVRDDEDGSFWSATPRPTGGDAGYLVRHAQGWSSFEHTRGDLAHELTVFVSPTDAVKTWRLRIKNDGKRIRLPALTLRRRVGVGFGGGDGTESRVDDHGVGCRRGRSLGAESAVSLSRARCLLHGDAQRGKLQRRQGRILRRRRVSRRTRLPRWVASAFRVSRRAASTRAAPCTCPSRSTRARQSTSPSCSARETISTLRARS